jgi:hypothetical protein
MALVFPPAPSLGQKYPVNPGTPGVTQYQWDGTKWNAVLSTISLGSPNQGAFNDYQWPATDGPAGYQLQTDGAGGLSWELESNNNLQAIGITPLPDGVNKIFTLVELGTFTSFTPVPSTNIVVFLGGVPQTPTTAYTVVADEITFIDSPPAGTTFYAISSTVVV